VDPLDRLRYAGRRMTDPFEALAQRVAERVLDLPKEPRFDTGPFRDVRKN